LTTLPIYSDIFKKIIQFVTLLPSPFIPCIAAKGEEME
jgi:hypothetical protein